MQAPGSLLSKGGQFRLSLWHDDNATTYFEYDSSSGQAVCDAGCDGWTPLAEPDVLLQKLFLMGSEDRFNEFFTNLVHVSVEFIADRPLGHVPFLALNDCRIDAHPVLRTSVIEPVLSQITVVGHLQWAWHYQVHANLSAALAHLDAAEAATAALQPSEHVLPADRISELTDDLWTLRARVRARENARRSGTLDGLQAALEDLARITEARKITYAYLVSLYECAKAAELAGRRLMLCSSTGRDDLATAEALFLQTSQRLTASSTKGEPALLLAAAQLGLARIANFRTDCQLGMHKRRSVPEAAQHAQSAIAIVESSCGAIDSHVVAIVKGAAMAEMGRWDEATSEWRHVASGASKGTREREIATLNVCLAHLTRDQLETAVLGAVEYTEIAPVHHLPFCNLILRIGRACPSAPNLASALEARAMNRVELTIDGDDCAATAHRLGQSSDPSDIHLVLRTANLIRYRRFPGVELDLLHVRLALRWYEACLLGSSTSPLYVAPSHLPKFIWDRVCSSTRWTMFEIFNERCFGRDSLERTHQRLCNTLLEEMDRHTVIPLRLAYRRLGHAAWDYVPSPSSSTRAIPASSATGFSGPVKTIRANGSVRAYVEHDLYIGQMELTLLQALLEKDRGFGFEKLTVNALGALKSTNPDLVGVLLGPVAVTAGMWVGPSIAQENERERLHSAVTIMKTARDYHAHRSKKRTPPDTASMLMAWRYLTTTAMLAAGAVQMRQLGAASVWDRPASDPRALWSARRSAATPTRRGTSPSRR